MDAIRQLRSLFRRQMTARGALAAGITISFVFGIGLITSNLSAWWFLAFPWMHDLALWVRASNPWDFFVFVFIVVNAFHYIQVVQGVYFDRYNLSALVALSRSELAEESLEDPNPALYRALLGGRRRLLESIIRFDPTLWSLGAVTVSLVAFGHWLSALCVLAFGGYLLWMIPRMITRFTRRRESALARDRERHVDGPKARLTDAREKADRSINETAARLTVFVNRPLERLRVGWPTLVAAATTVAAITALTVSDMHRSGELPARATLLIMLLVLTARAALSSAQHSEDLAFFASALAEIEESEDGTETI